METIPPISLKLNFTPNTLGCYGLRNHSYKNHNEFLVICHDWMDIYSYVKNNHNVDFHDFTWEPRWFHGYNQNHNANRSCFPWNQQPNEGVLLSIRRLLGGRHLSSVLSVFKIADFLPLEWDPVQPQLKSPLQLTYSSWKLFHKENVKIFQWNNNSDAYVTFKWQPYFLQLLKKFYFFHV